MYSSPGGTAAALAHVQSPSIFHDYRLLTPFRKRSPNSGCRSLLPLSPHQTLKRRMVMDRQRRAPQFRKIVSSELREQAGDRLPAGANQLRDFLMGHGQPDPRRPVRDLGIGSRVEQEASEPFRNRMRQPERANHSIGIRAIPRQMLRSMERGVRMLAEELQHVVPPHEIQLAGLHRFHRQLIRTARNHCMQSQNLTRLRDTNNQRLAVARRGRKFGASLAQNEYSPRTLPLHQHHRSEEHTSEL